MILFQLLLIGLALAACVMVLTRLRKPLTVLALAAIVLLATSTPVLAAGDSVVPRDDTVLTIPLLLVTIIAGTLIPIVHGLITKANAATPVKVIVGLVLSAIAGLINTATVLDGVAVFSKTAVVAAGLAWITQVATYLNIFKPLGAPQLLAPSVGIGPAPAQP